MENSLFDTHTDIALIDRLLENFQKDFLVCAVYGNNIA